MSDEVEGWDTASVLDISSNKDSALLKRIMRYASEGKSPQEVSALVGGVVTGPEVYAIVSQAVKQRSVWDDATREMLLLDRVYEHVGRLEDRLDRELFTDESGKAGPDASWANTLTNTYALIQKMVTGRKLDMETFMAEFNERQGSVLIRIVEKSTLAVFEEMDDELDDFDKEYWLGRFRQALSMNAAQVDAERGA